MASKNDVMLQEHAFAALHNVLLLNRGLGVACCG